MFKFVLAVLVSFITVIAQTTVSLEVSADASGVIPLAIIPFQPSVGSEMSGETKPWEVVAADLDFTGSFNVVKLNQIDTLVFREKMIPVYITGNYTLNGDTMTMEAHLYDVVWNESMFGKSYKFAKKDFRAVAHRFSSEIHKVLTGEDNSPYESKVVFVERNEKNEKNIVVSDYDGQNRRYITRGGINIMPSFIDKGRILCVAYDKGKPDIYEIDAGTTKKTQIFASRKVQSSPNYSDITGRIAFGSSKSGNMEIYTMSAQGGGEERLTVNPPAISTAPNWSPDGFRLAFVSDRAGSPQIYTMTNSGTGVKRISFGGNYHDSPAFSPDGTTIAYTARRNGRNMIAIISADGGDETLLTSEMNGAQEYPSWSPDGSNIIFTQKLGGRTNINAVRVKDKRVLAITESGTAEQSKFSR